MGSGSVRSADDTTIGFEVVGSGRPIVFVHGSVSSGVEWRAVADLLADRFCCVLMDRRGRGASGDRPEYSIRTECEDIAAVLEAAGPEAAGPEAARRGGADPAPILFGHSYGAICALETARTARVARLILYEPPFPVGGSVAGPYLAAYRDAIAAGDLDTAVEIGMTRFVGLPVPAVAAMRPTPVWGRLATLAPTWTRELDVIEGLGPSLDRFREVAVPTLLLLGTESAAHPLKEATVALASTLPNAIVVPLPGQGHMAARFAPQLVADAISRFAAGGAAA